MTIRPGYCVDGYAVVLEHIKDGATEIGSEQYRDHGKPGVLRPTKPLRPSKQIQFKVSVNWVPAGLVKGWNVYLNSRVGREIQRITIRGKPSEAPLLLGLLVLWR